MYLRKQRILDKKKDKELIAYAETFSVKATALYNACLFRIRQVFTGWAKPVKTQNEEAVFRETETLKKACPDVSVRKRPTYKAMEKWMRVLEVPEFSDGLPMQTAQRVVKQAVQNFQSWLAACKSFRENPSAFTGTPKMPGYKKRGSFSTFEISNQDAVFYPVSGKESLELKLPLTKDRVRFSGISDPASLMNVCFKPFFDSWILFLDFRVTDECLSAMEEGKAYPLSGKHMAAVDFGVSNAAAIAVNDSSGLICKGGVMKSEIRLFCKKKGKAQAAITHGKEHVSAKSKYLTGLSVYHHNFLHDQCHKISRYLVDYCKEHQVGTLVLGNNRYWKQGSDMIKQNNQMFELMPLAKLRDMIAYKAQMAGILVVLQEESYTSKADFLSGDYIPTCGVDDGKAAFSGRRKKRGLYQSGTGIIVNADMNGAANILRKAFPKAFAKTKDFRFLADPEVLTYRKLEKVPEAKKNCPENQTV